MMAKKKACKGDIWKWTMAFSDGEVVVSHLLFLQKRQAYNITDNKKEWWWDVLIIESGNYETYPVTDLFLEDFLGGSETWEQVG